MLENTQTALDTLQELDADLMLLQEVDENAHRSYRVNQRELTAEAFPGYSHVWGENFHSGFLFYPFNDPHGDTTAGLQTLSRYRVEKAVRRSYPIDEDFFIKFTDLDRCFTVLYLPVEDTDRQLVVVPQPHVRPMTRRYRSGPGSWNCCARSLPTSTPRGTMSSWAATSTTPCTAPPTPLRASSFPGWVQTMDDTDLPDHFAFVEADNGFEVPTCRGADIPYTPGVNYTTVVDVPGVRQCSGQRPKH